MASSSFLQQPISLRLPFIFYLGHLPNFAHYHLRQCLDPESVFLKTAKQVPNTTRFDAIFLRGIDPDVDDPTKCHQHSTIPTQWPALADIITYRNKVRELLLKGVQEMVSNPVNNTTLMAHYSRVFDLTAEHDLMHAETLLYMYSELPPHSKQPPADAIINYIFAKSPVQKGKMITIPAGTAALGANIYEQKWGWDNEFPLNKVKVPTFKIDQLPVTIGEFLEFVKSGEYNHSKHWKQEDFIWKTQNNLNHPHMWKLVDGTWYYQSAFDLLPLNDVLDWPVYVSHAEAHAYATWKGKRLPTEAEWHRAAYGTNNPDAPPASHPWGDMVPTKGVHGNFDFFSWAPTPVGMFPHGSSYFGVLDLIGNGWEWTSTPFEGHDGFEAWIPHYPGYSADFFDGKHYVMLGASWATGTSLVRRTFRNWYQAHYLYMFSKFRCVQ